MRPDVSSLVRGRGVHLGSLPAVLADRYGDRPAVEDPGPTPGLDHGPVRTFRDIEEAVARLAGALHERGCRPEQRVLVVVDNRLDVALHLFALARLGAVPVPVNDRLTATELAAVARATEAAAAVADPDVVDRLPAGIDVLRTDELGELVHAHPGLRVLPERRRRADEVAVLLTTSGTTGVPKAAALTSRGLLSALGRLAALPVGRRRGLRADRDRVLAALPLTHVMGFAVLIAALCAGVPLIRRGRFDAAEFLDLVETRRPNVVVAVPTMYADLEHAGAADRDLSSVQVWISSADAMPTDRARRFQTYGAGLRVAGRGVGTAVFIDIYGMVELSGAAAVRVLPPSPVGTLPAPSFAVSLPGIEVRAVDEDGRPVRRGTVGELQWRGPSVLREYRGQERAGLDGDGWFSSGDHGRILGLGLFQFAGRSKDRLKVGGFSVFPAEVEEELRDAPGVREFAIVGVPDERLGERPVAAVVAGDGFDADAFLGWARAQTAGYRRPHDVVRLDHLPRGANGKVDRAAATQAVLDQLGVTEEAS